MNIEQRQTADDLWTTDQADGLKPQLHTQLGGNIKANPHSVIIQRKMSVPLCHIKSRKEVGRRTRPVIVSPSRDWRLNH